MPGTGVSMSGISSLTSNRQLEADQPLTDPFYGFIEADYTQI